jgi:hypothetical protein
MEQPSEQPFDQNENGSQFGCLASYCFLVLMAHQVGLESSIKRIFNNM